MNKLFFENWLEYTLKNFINDFQTNFLNNFFKIKHLKM